MTGRQGRTGEKWSRTRTRIPSQTRLRLAIPSPKRGPGPGTVRGWGGCRKELTGHTWSRPPARPATSPLQSHQKRIHSRFSFKVRSPPGSADLRDAPPSPCAVGGARGVRARRRSLHAACGVPSCGPSCSSLCASLRAFRGASSRHVPTSSARRHLGRPSPARHGSRHYGDGAPHGCERQRRDGTRLYGSRP